MAVDSARVISLFLHNAGRNRAAVWQPAADIYKLPTGWLIKLELAGVRSDDVQLILRGHTLLVTGRRRDACLEAGCRQLRLEIEYGRFEREIELPADWPRATVETEFQDG